MITINCPKCNKKTSFQLNEAIDELGEVFRCKHCGYMFRYTER